MSRAREVSKVISTVQLVEDSIDNIDLSSSINTASAAAVAYLIDGAPAALNTLNELAAALNDNESFATTVTNELSSKLSISSASSTYLPQTNASATYLPLTGGSVNGSLSVSGNIINSTRPGFKARISGGPTVAQGTILPFNSTFYNIGNHFNTSTYKFTVPITGFYQVDLQLRIETGTNQYLHAMLFDDSNTMIDELFSLENGNSEGFTAAAGSMMFRLNQGTIVHLRCGYSSAGSRTFIAQNTWAMTYVG